MTDLDNILTKQEGEELFLAMEKSGEDADSIENLRRNFLARTFVFISTAFEPRREFLIKVRDWFSKNMGKDVVLDLKVDEAVCAGAIVICNNHYRDYSMGRVLEEEIREIDGDK